MSGAPRPGSAPRTQGRRAGRADRRRLLVLASVTRAALLLCRVACDVTMPPPESAVTPRGNQAPAPGVPCPGGARGRPNPPRRKRE